jgi:hypothetical protein
VIFYAIYKKLGNSLYYFSCAFAAGTLERIFLSQCDPWARLAGVGEPNSGELPPGLAREGRGKGAGVARDQFGGDLGAEVTDGGVCSGHRRC